MIDATILPVAVGQVFHWVSDRLVFQGAVGDRLHITDDDGNVFTIDDEELDGEAMPKTSWFLREYLNGNITIPSASGRENNRFERLERLDLMAATLRDPPCLKRFVWAKEACAAGLGQNEKAVGAWIVAQPIPAIPALAWTNGTSNEAIELNRKLARTFASKPGARSVMEWMKKLKAAGGRISTLVNKAGRPLGHSQLPSKVDLLVERASDLFYERPEALPTIEDAAALVARLWKLAKDEGVEALGDEPPDYESIRRRIRRKETFENYERRYGRAAAVAKFSPKGEGVEPSRPFETVFMDGTEFEHYTLYSDNWREVAGKMKGVAAMDAFSLYKWPYAVFYGPLRPEMSLQALMNVLIGPRSSCEELDDDPTRLIFGIPSTVVYDNDRALLPPSLSTSLMRLGQILLNGVYHPNGKSPLEVSFKHDKQRLRTIKGRVLLPAHHRDPRYDPKKEANLTKEQYRVAVERARRDWNRTPKRVLGDRSPNDVMLEYLKHVGVQRYHA